ncbi:MAG: hypothetical protein KAS04_04195 [Candidatus Aenigmarchaeota archaeon]|nr:hypothetical protein [Candidatus Aenigmarchaeota archaeon]
MKKKSFFMIPLIFLIMIFSGCVQQSSGPTCNSPYIVKGYECCLDQNNNNICDSDEQTTEQPTKPVEYCGDKNCNSDEDCETCQEDCGECPEVVDSETEDMKSIVYNAVIKYIPEAAGSDFIYEERSSKDIGFDTWYYPKIPSEINTSVHVVSIQIKDHHFNITSPQSLYERFTESPDFGTDDILFKKLGNGDILITDKNADGKYDFSVEFTCKRRYEIKIQTWDFYGTDVLDLYKNYDIDRLDLERAADEILGRC